MPSFGIAFVLVLNFFCQTLSLAQNLANPSEHIENPTLSYTSSSFREIPQRNNGEAKHHGRALNDILDSNLLSLLPKRLQVCDNIIVNDIPGNVSTVLEAGRRYVESMHNFSISPPAPFGGAWKWEVFRMDFPKVPECLHLKIFGDEKKNYDEAKRFCYYPNAKSTDGNKCVAYSIGSNDKWAFEEDFFAQSDCTIETFDCTCNASVPAAIRSRTRFHQVCLGTSNNVDPKGLRFSTLPNINKIVGRQHGPDYFKMDIEGYEWAMLRSLAKQADINHEVHAHLPLQIYAEYHLDRESLEDNTFVQRDGRSAHVGKRLRHFFDELFTKAGYMMMHVRTTLQTRNTDILLVKVFCPVSPE